MSVPTAMSSFPNFLPASRNVETEPLRPNDPAAPQQPGAPSKSGAQARKPAARGQAAGLLARLAAVPRNDLAQTAWRTGRSLVGQFSTAASISVFASRTRTEAAAPVKTAEARPLLTQSKAPAWRLDPPDAPQLSLTGRQIGWEGVESVAKMLSVNHALKSLDLSQNSLDTHGVQYLGEGLAQNRGLERLDLATNNLDAQNARYLAQGLQKQAEPTLTWLRLDHNYLRDKGTAAIAALLPDYPTLRSLSLRSTRTGDEGAIAIAHALEPTANSDERIDASELQHLDLSENLIGDEGAEALAQALVLSRVETLDLSGNRIGEDGVEALARALVSGHIKTLDLSGNKVGVAGALALAIALGSRDNPPEARASASGNAPGHDAFAAPATGADTAPCALETLTLAHADIGPWGAMHLGEALTENTRLKRLDLRENGIGTPGAKFFAKYVKGNASLEVLQLSDNKIGDDAVPTLAEALSSMTSLREVDLSGNRFSDENVEKLFEACGHIPNVYL
ncbi:hypothetical protein CY652_21780 [Burkholderia sp. WAC0059]|uniref:hypothetical protein n=1 Tax=Burkholderia sp. WAC0059 TaxID=2066022 RepID=UPI000CA76E78|nr:hypothetical protein [Burkholderia sp. WAC0059]PLZ00275.1 hypothetical protein CY652_21780 [Burkholderia sp. WAC0059]